MHLIQALFLWLFMAGFTVGGAAAFLRFFPGESPWFGSLLPPLGLVVPLNFVEHFVALPTLSATPVASPYRPVWQVLGKLFVLQR